MYALNFYSPMVVDQLRTRRKTATIRVGDKSAKYKKGMVVQVLVGARYGPRDKIFDAVIDKVEVKPLADLSPREIDGTSGRQLILPLLEVALSGAAREADGDPVAEGLAPLFLQPVAGLTHGADCRRPWFLERATAHLGIAWCSGSSTGGVHEQVRNRSGDRKDQDSDHPGRDLAA
jgi:hypothetical protein